MVDAPFFVQRDSSKRSESIFKADENSGILLRLAPGKPPGQGRTLSLAMAFACSSSVRVGGRVGRGCETFTSNAHGATGELSRLTRCCALS